ncbi:hypothetical protein AcV7_005955 [Taiwanofungus camphoratus]|nr:hypothetical protein AcV7_005955 [Antrodia cinnamomea]
MSQYSFCSVSRPLAVSTKMTASSSSRSAPSAPSLLRDGTLLARSLSVPIPGPSGACASYLPPRPASAPPTVPSYDFRSKSLRNFANPPRSSHPEGNNSSFLTKEQTGGLPRPPPPLLRPTTFWRNNIRSGVTGASYSPSSHVIRRSTFVAAGLTLDQPIADLSALCVESRVGVIFLPPDAGL